MAYGKDPKQLATTSSFRQRANSYQQQKEQSRKRSGGGGGIYWANQYKPGTADIDTIRVLEGNYNVPQPVGQGKDAHVEIASLPFFPYAEHYDGREGKSAICSAGPFAGSKERATPCVGCEIFFSTMERDQNGRRKQGRMSKRDMYAFSILDYGVYHNVEQVDFKTGQPRLNEQTGMPWMHWIKCEGQGCAACRNNKESRAGSTRHWGLGWGHYQTLLDADKKIGKSCSGCQGVNTIQCVAWTCPQCGDAIVDMSTTALKTKEIDELVSNTVSCSCGYQGFSVEIIECRSCTPVGGTAKRATIFDVDININRVESSDGGNQTALSISNWGAPGPVDPRFAEFNKPLDLAKIYAPTPIDKQKGLFGVTGPIQRTPVEVSRPYQEQDQTGAVRPALTGTAWNTQNSKNQ